MDTIILPHTNGREGAVEDAEGVPLACLNKSLLFAGFCQAEALGRLQFLDSEPAIPQIQFGVLERDPSFCVGVEYPQVIVCLLYTSRCV